MTSEGEISREVALELVDKWKLCYKLKIIDTEFRNIEKIGVSNYNFEKNLIILEEKLHRVENINLDTLMDELYLVEPFLNIGRMIKDAIKDATKPITNEIDKVVDGISDLGKTVARFPDQAWGFVETNVNGAIKGATDPIISTFTKITADMTKGFNNVVNVMEKNLTSVWKQAEKTLTNKMEALNDAASSAMKEVTNELQSTINSVKNTLENIVETVQEEILKIVNTIKKTLQRAIDEIKNFAEEAFEAVENGVNKAIKTVVDTTMGVVKKIEKSANKFAKFAKNMFKVLLKKLKQLFEKAMKLINKIMDMLGVVMKKIALIPAIFMTIFKIIQQQFVIFKKSIQFMIEMGQLLFLMIDKMNLCYYGFEPLTELFIEDFTEIATQLAVIISDITQCMPVYLNMDFTLNVSNLSIDKITNMYDKCVLLHVEDFKKIYYRLKVYYDAGLKVSKDGRLRAKEKSTKFGSSYEWCNKNFWDKKKSKKFGYAKNCNQCFNPNGVLARGYDMMNDIWKLMEESFELTELFMKLTKQIKQLFATGSRRRRRRRSGNTDEVEEDEGEINIDEISDAAIGLISTNVSAFAGALGYDENVVEEIAAPVNDMIGNLLSSGGMEDGLNSLTSAVSDTATALAETDSSLSDDNPDLAEINSDVGESNDVEEAESTMETPSIKVSGSYTSPVSEQAQKIIDSLEDVTAKLCAKNKDKKGACTSYNAAVDEVTQIITEICKARKTSGAICSAPDFEADARINGILKQQLPDGGVSLDFLLRYQG